MAKRLLCGRVSQFSYFDEILGRPEWAGKKILDFGGNVGGFLAGSGESVRHSDYWCLELNQEALQIGRERYPEAHFVYYPRYSAEYNPEGRRNEPIPDLGEEFDFVLAFSVFTHTHRAEMVDLVEQLRRLLKPGGALAFTFCDPRYDKSITAPDLPPGADVRKMLEEMQPPPPLAEIERMARDAARAQWCVLIDDALHIEPEDSLSTQKRNGKPWESYCAYFTTDHIQTLFPEGRIHPPVPPEWQHCCVLTPAPPQ